MQRNIRTGLIVLASLLGLAVAGSAALGFATLSARAQPGEAALPGGGKPQSLPEETLEVRTRAGVRKFRVMMARTEEQRALGLMFRREMAPDQGMIFDFFTPQPVAFWMRGTILPLDIIFIDGDGRILNIAANARPFDETPLPADGPTRAVLEINGGLAARLGIRPGDQVLDDNIYHR